MTARLTFIASNPDAVLRVDGKLIRIRDISAIEPSASRLIVLVHLVGGARLEVRLFDAVPPRATTSSGTFFVLEGAKSDEDMRGFYNEFLHSRLEPHRKVFEVIGDKTKCQPTKGHLAGLGFSSTKKDSFLVRVQQGKKQRIFNVLVGG